MRLPARLQPADRLRARAADRGRRRRRPTGSDRGSCGRCFRACGGASLAHPPPSRRRRFTKNSDIEWRRSRDRRALPPTAASMARSFWRRPDDDPASPPGVVHEQSRRKSPLQTPLPSNASTPGCDSGTQTADRARKGKGPQRPALVRSRQQLLQAIASLKRRRDRMLRHTVAPSFSARPKNGFIHTLSG